MVVDPLEPYRQMARSIRFVPPVWQPQQLYKKLTQSPPIAASLETSCPPNRDRAFSSQVDSPIDAAAHTAALIQAAVSHPTTLPAVYHLPENIGDRISRMGLSSTPAPVQAVAVVIAPPAPATPIESVSLTQPTASTIEPIEPPAATVVATHAEPEPSHPNPVSAAVLNSEPSSKTAQWLGSMADYLTQVSEQLEAAAPPACPQCGSTHLRKKGIRGNSQRYLCKQCGRNFAQALPPLTASEPTSKTAAKRRSLGFGKREKIR